MAENNKKKLGDRAWGLVEKGVNSIPNNAVTRGIGTGFNFINANVNRNPLSRFYTKAEDFVVDKGGDLAEKHLGVNENLARLGLGFMLPGPGGQARALGKGVNTKRALGIGKRTLPIKNRTIGVKELLPSVTEPYRRKLKDYLNNKGMLIGHTTDPNVGKLTAAGQTFRGKLNRNKGVASVKIKPDLKGKEEALKRKKAIFEQTVNEGDIKTFKGGHHKLEIDLGTAITSGMDPNQVKPFWKLVQRSYPNLFPGNHPKNIVKFEKGFNAKLHAEVHRKLNKAGLDPKKVINELTDQPASVKFNFLKKVEADLTEIDDWLGSQLNKATTASNKPKR